MNIPDKDLITSIDDFLDERAKELAVLHNISLEQIPLTFIAFQKSEGHIRTDLKNPSTPLNIYDTYIRQLASCAALCYELTKRTQVFFDNPIIPGKVFGFARVATVKEHKTMAQVYEKTICLIQKDKKARIDEAIEKLSREE